MQEGDHEENVGVTRCLDHVARDKAEYAAAEAAEGAEDAPNRRDSAVGEQVRWQCKEHGTIDLNGERAKADQGEGDGA